jgi:hypothetical protein
MSRPDFFNAGLEIFSVSGQGLASNADHVFFAKGPL